MPSTLCVSPAWVSDTCAGMFTCPGSVFELPAEQPDAKSEAAISTAIKVLLNILIFIFIDPPGFHDFFTF
jgi:hypothetical protein